MCIRKVAGACLIVLACARVAAAQSAGRPSAGRRTRPQEQSSPPRASQWTWHRNRPSTRNRSSSVPRRTRRRSSTRPRRSASSAARPSSTPPRRATPMCSARVPGVNVTQTSARDINITSRGASLHAVDVAAGAGRRPQHLSRFLRVHRVGLPAGESRGDQADRSHPRSRLGHLGRQRTERRRQRHHEDAARDPGLELHDRASADSTASRR